MWVGDDAAVLTGAARLLFASDVLVEEVHFRRTLSSLADVGWKALATNVSDLAAMGATPLGAVVAIVGADRAGVEALFDGLLAAGATYDCPVVGGDLSDGPALVVSVAILGSASGPPVLRSGGHPGDRLFLTGPTGAASLGLRLLLADPSASGSCVEAHRRPLARLREGRAAALGGATAMIDVSDGLGIDLDRLASASRVGVEIDAVPTADGATFDDAFAGGDDYELLFSAPDADLVATAFADAGLRPPVEFGRLVADAGVRTLEGRVFDPVGYAHELR